MGTREEYCGTDRWKDDQARERARKQSTPTETANDDDGGARLAEAAA